MAAENNWSFWSAGCPDSSQGRVNFCSSQDDLGQVLELAVYYLRLLPRAEGRDSPPGRMEIFHSRKCSGGSCWVMRVLSNHMWTVCLSCTLWNWYRSCYCSFSFLISVSSKCCLSQPMVFPFVPPILFSSRLLDEDKEKARQQCTVSVGTLNRGIVFLKHNAGICGCSASVREVFLNLTKERFEVLSNNLFFFSWSDLCNDRWDQVARKMEIGSPGNTEDTKMLSTDIQSLYCYAQQHNLGLKYTGPTSGRKTNHIGQKKDSSFCGRMWY